MSTKVSARIKTKRDTALNWDGNNPVLLDGEMIIVDTADGDMLMKIGDGVSPYNQLPFYSTGNSSEASDSIKYTEQVLTDEQKVQARTNIGAMSEDIKYAASDSIGGAATSAVKLNNARTIQVDLNSQNAGSFSGEKNITIGVTGTLPVSNGGTGKTAGVDAANYFIDSLTPSDSVSQDNDYFIGNENNSSTFHKKPLSKFWEYIKEKLIGVENVNISGNAATSDFSKTASTLSGFSQRTEQKWGNQIGEFVNGGTDGSGGEFAFRRNNPSNGKLSMIVNGGFYQNDGQYMCLDTNNYTDYAPTKTGNGASGNWDINILGSAETANKLSKLRTVSGGTDVTLNFSYDGSANSTANAGFYSCSSIVGNTNNYPYHRFAKIDTITEAPVDKTMTVYVSQDYNNGGFGICRISLRANNSTSDASVEAKWLVRSGLPVNMIQIALRKDSSGACADAFIETTEEYSSCTVRAIASGARGEILRTWTLVTSQEANDTTTESNGSSSECWVSIDAAGVELHSQAYSTVISAEDSAIIETSNNVKDNGNNNTITLAYSKPELKYDDYSYITAWNGYELRAVDKAQFAAAGHKHIKDHIIDFPTSLKNPYSLTIQTNGVDAVTYDGATSETINITKDSIGLGNVDNTADSEKLVKHALNSDYATNSKYSESAETATTAETATNANYATSASYATSANNGVTASGSNYVRFGNGTQICWGSVSSTSGTFSFPVAFYNTSYAASVTDRVQGKWANVACTSKSTSYMNYYTESGSADIIAVGRWK